ncbi:MAG TPA: hypothetical protein VGL56_09755 [Fimbriimonadaceae bacterium]|jgi:hypothetical protein
MNTTLQGIDARGYLQGWLKNLVNMYTSDVNAIPEDKWNVGMGGCTRPASELTADALSFVAWTTRVLNGEAPRAEGEAMKELTAACATKEGAVTTVQGTADAFAAALAAASEESLAKPVMTPFGMEMPLFLVCQIAVNHVWYHDGQLNYIHCLLGDGEMHWMSE